MSLSIGNGNVSGLYVGSQEAYKAYLGSTLVYSKELPNVSYLCNYNARNFNAATQTFVRSENSQLFAYDLTNNVGNTGHTYTKSGGCVSLDGHFAFQHSFADASSNPFNVDNGNTELTVIYKASFNEVANAVSLVANRMENTDTDWTVHKNVMNIGTGNYGEFLISTGQVATVVIRIDNQGVLQRKWIEQNRSASDTVHTISLDYVSDKINFFGDIDAIQGSVVDIFMGDFYWLYISRNYLTDAQVAEVIAYNG